MVIISNYKYTAWLWIFNDIASSRHVCRLCWPDSAWLPRVSFWTGPPPVCSSPKCPKHWFWFRLCSDSRAIWRWLWLRDSQQWPIWDNWTKNISKLRHFIQTSHWSRPRQLWSLYLHRYLRCWLYIYSVGVNNNSNSRYIFIRNVFIQCIIHIIFTIYMFNVSLCIRNVNIRRNDTKKI